MPTQNPEQLTQQLETFDQDDLERFPGFKKRLDWFLENRPDLASLISRWMEMGSGNHHLLALTRGHRMKCVLARMLDETESGCGETREEGLTWRLAGAGVRQRKKYSCTPYQRRAIS